MSPTTTGNAVLVRTQSELDPLVEQVRAHGRMAMDTEFMREKTYFARLCLVQVAVTAGVWVIDPLENIDVEPLAALLADPGVEVVVHAGKQDFDIFVERFGTVPTRVFDVQIAAGFVGHGASLPYGRLVEAVCRVQLTKGEAYTDWCRRPLTQAQMRYAADDVRYLLQAADALTQALERSGRIEWAREEMGHLEASDSYGVDLDLVWRKVSGRGALGARQAGVLRRLARWRETAAAEKDIPRGWMVKDATLVEIARRMPTSLEALRAIRGLGERVADRWGADILKAVEVGRKAPPIENERPPPRSALTRARMMAGLADAIVRARAEQAGIATELVTTRAELDALLVEVVTGRLHPERHRLLTGWRQRLAGAAVVALAEGKVAVRTTNRAPYIEEISIDGSEKP